MLYFIDVLRAVATVFILNSHFDKLYPIEIAIGGEYGLALFFIIAGFLSAKVNKDTKFLQWYFKRFLRLYIPLILWTMILLVIREESIQSLWDVFTLFVYPTGRWFVSFIMILYAIFFVFKKYILTGDTLIDKKRTLIAIGALLAVYFIIYLFEDNTVPHNLTYSWHTRILWIICALVGLMIRETNIVQEAKKKRAVWFSVFILFLFMYGGFKLLYVYRRLLELQFVCLFAPIASSIGLFVFFGTLEERIKKLSNNKVISTIYQLFSRASLEIYIIQFTFIHLFTSIVFPFNVLLVVICVVTGGNILHCLSEFLINLIYRKRRNKAC